MLDNDGGGMIISVGYMARRTNVVKMFDGSRPSMPVAVDQGSVDFPVYCVDDLGIPVKALA